MRASSSLGEGTVGVVHVQRQIARQQGADGRGARDPVDDQAGRGAIRAQHDRLCDAAAVSEHGRDRVVAESEAFGLPVVNVLTAVIPQDRGTAGAVVARIQRRRAARPGDLSSS